MYEPGDDGTFHRQETRHRSPLLSSNVTSQGIISSDLLSLVLHSVRPAVSLRTDEGSVKKELPRRCGITKMKGAFTQRRTSNGVSGTLDKIYDTFGALTLGRDYFLQADSTSTLYD